MKNRSQKITLLLVVLCAMFASLTAFKTTHSDYGLELKKIAEKVNSNEASTWKADTNSRFAFMSKEEVSRRAAGSVRKESVLSKFKVLEPKQKPKDTPVNFDSREQWPDCPTIGKIYDTAQCASDWALGPMQIVQDRICIKSGQKYTVELSYEDILTCCTNCWMRANACVTGSPYDVLHYIADTGVCTGGGYGNDNYCKPYYLPPCAHYGHSAKYPDCPSGEIYPLKCTYQCTNRDYKIPYGSDFHYADYVNMIPMNDIDRAEQELIDNGPIFTSMDIYEDFLTYKSGVYSNSTGNYVAHLSFKIIGFGHDDASGLDYWIGVNGWNEGWGDNGTFKIIKGIDLNNMEKKMASVSTGPKSVPSHKRHLFKQAQTQETSELKPEKITFE